MSLSPPHPPNFKFASDVTDFNRNKFIHYIKFNDMFQYIQKLNIKRI